MPNHHRGEIDCVIGARRTRLCLTLGALAEIESGLGADGLAALGERFAGGRLSARDIIVILGAAARGAGETLTDDELAKAPLARDLPQLVAAVVDLLRFAFAADEKEPNPNPR